MTGIAELQALGAAGRIVRGVLADRWHAATLRRLGRALWSATWCPATCGRLNCQPAAR